MIDTLFVQLDKKEEVLGVVRRSLLYKWWRWLLAITWLLIPFFFFYPLVKLGIIGIFLFTAFIFTGIWNALRRWREWYYTMLLTTDRRIIDIDQRGFFHRELEELTFREISEVKVIKTPIQRITNIGSIHIRTLKVRKFDLELVGVRCPENVRDLIVDVQYITGEYVDQAKAKQ